MPRTSRERFFKAAGFTLIELLVVISVIGFLSTLTITMLNSARIKARDAKRQADLVQIQKAIELYFIDNSYYPQCGTDVCSTTGYASNMSNLAVVPQHMAKMPLDPTNINGSYGYYYARGYKRTGPASFVYTALAIDYILATRLEGMARTFSGWNNTNLNILLGN
ncbi:MAG: prepilin-type N-terminal cleavage/methylation domain-containing protein [Patescibacteria group bacterium]|nr:prepilin-type N-terminal cleavage/methylation domain-containing protein [Patescibacteria group bacterium]